MTTTVVKDERAKIKKRLLEMQTELKAGLEVDKRRLERIKEIQTFYQAKAKAKKAVPK